MISAEKKRAEVMRLWEAVFDDTADFVRFYFNQVYKDQNAMLIEKGGQVVSALQLLPYTMSFYGEELPVAYISGACTLPSQRGKGLMGELLGMAALEMERRKVALAVLIPAGKGLFEYYRAHGYTEAFDYSTEKYSPGDAARPDISVQPDNRPGEAAYAFFKRKMGERIIAIQHSREDFSLILKDMELSKGQLFIAVNDDKSIAGMAFTRPKDTEAGRDKGGMLVNDILYDDEVVKNRMLHEISRLHSPAEIFCRVPCDHRLPASPYGMARIVDRPRLIRAWLAAHPQSRLSGDDMLAMDGPALTRHLMNYHKRQAFMSLMLD
jgi:GNAT superfamily N-acetyltransferase